MDKNGRVGLTKAVIEAAQPPAKDPKFQKFLRDRAVRGFGLRITADGTKTFIWEGRVRGRVRRITIGRYPDLSVLAARNRAQEIRTAIAQGRDSADERIAERHQQTFGDLIDAYLDRYAKLHRRSWPTDERRLRVHCARWSSRRLCDIKRSDVEKLHHQVAENSGPVEANRTVELLRAMFSKAALWELMSGPNPALGFDRSPEQARERFLSPQELTRVNEALLAEPDWRWRNYFPLLLLLGARKSELLRARWEHVDLEQRLWLIPTSKTDLSRFVPLPAPAVQIIERLSSRGQSDWLFPVRVASSSGHTENAGVAWRRIRERAGVPDVRVHDLRRTLGSWLAGAGYSLPIIGKALGHSTAAATQIYARLALDPVREALERNAALMTLGGKRESPEA
jgi:integrase